MDNEQKYRLVLDYDGSRFSGWQVQPDRRTVQGEIETALNTILGARIRLTAAGRTDAGVHATGQVASFTAPAGMEPERMKRALNGVMPPDITVVEASGADPRFNPRFDATSRTYRYTLTGRKISVGRAYAWHVRYPLAQNLLDAAASRLNGTVSLEGFSKKNDDDDYTTMIYNTGWTFNGTAMVFEISAIRFFQHAVRSIVGTLVTIARGRETPDLIDRILETGDRTLAGPLAPAAGLCLVHVGFGENRTGTTGPESVTDTTSGSERT